MSNYPEIYYSYSSIKKEVKIPKILEGAMKNDINMIKLGLDNGENINSSLDDDDTALHLSSYKGNIEIVQLLLNHPKIDVNAVNIDYNTSLLQLCKREEGELTIEHIEIIHKKFLTNPEMPRSKAQKNGANS